MTSEKRPRATITDLDVMSICRDQTDNLTPDAGAPLSDPSVSGLHAFYELT